MGAENRCGQIIERKEGMRKEYSKKKMGERMKRKIQRGKKRSVRRSNI